MTMATSHTTNIDDRAIDHSLAQWVLKRTGSSLLAAAARAASHAEGLGHSCAWLTDPYGDGGFDADALQALRQHDWVGDGSAFSPFVLDPQNRFYLWRNWQHETRLAAAILQRCTTRDPATRAEALAADLDALFAAMPAEPSRGQRAAVAAVAGSRFFVLTGGPGTGKTTTVIRMLLMLLRHARACGLPANPSIALAAPTGKAAQRLAQAIAKGKAELQTTLPETAPNSAAASNAAGVRDARRHAIEEPHQELRMQAALLQHIPHADARTLHRLLGYQPRDNHFRHGPHNPLAEDIVVVDEASMVDLAMMRQLLQSLRPDAVLILLGDPGQLASVDAGSVLADIVAASKPAQTAAASDHAPPLAGHVVTLTHSWRAGSGLQRSIEALRDTPDPAWLDALLRERSDAGLQLRRCADDDSLRTCVDNWIERHAELLHTLHAPGIAPATALQHLRQMQVLCALRDGPFGAQGLNALFARRLATRLDIDVGTPWYHGRPVIITRNDYARGLYNGDVGIALEGAQGLRVWFELSERDGAIGLHDYSPRALTSHDSAWAITVHRSQGSEYHDVAVVLPPDADNRILTRELVYTAISRAKNHAEIWATDNALRAALARSIRRLGGLRERLQSESEQGHIIVRT